MFDFVQKNTVLIKVILGAVALTFVGFGVGSYTTATDDNYLAEVGDSRIYSRDIDQALQGQPTNPVVRQQMLDMLIRQRLLLAEAEKAGLVITPAMLQRAIAAMPAVQKDGRFDPAMYQAYLASQNLSADAFEQNVMRELRLDKQIQALAASAFLPKTVTERLAITLAEVREINPLWFRPEKFTDRVQLAPDAIKAAYEKDKQQYVIPEAVKLEYIEITLDQIAATIPIEAAEIEKYFEEHKAELAREERQLAHILFALPQGANNEVRQNTRQQAETVLSLLQEKPEQFAALARQHSQDPGSAARGGDLGYVPRGVMVKSFEEAAFKLNKGQFSELVESEFGFHIIKVQDIRSPDLKSVKPSIVERLQKQKANALYRQKVEEAGELAYQKADSLQAVADLLKTKQQTSEWLERNTALPSPLAQPKLLEAVFGDDVLKQKHNSEAIEIAPGRTVIARVVEHRPAQQQPLEQVSAQIERELRLQQANTVAQEAGKAFLAKLKAGQASDQYAWGPLQRVSREAPIGLSPEEARVVFSAKLKPAPAYVGTAVGDGSYVIYRVAPHATPPAKNAERQAELAARLTELQVGQDAFAYVNSLQQTFPIKIKPVKATD